MTLTIIILIILMIYFVICVTGPQKLPYRQMTKEEKGAYGESLIEEILRNVDDSPKYILRNIYIPKANKKDATEIDLIMLHRTGIYVFESKNFSGWIFGNSEQENWTQTLGYNGKYKFYNPIKQNAGHIEALRRFLDYNDSYCMFSYIVFNNECELKSVPESTESVKIINRNVLQQTIKYDLDTRRFLFEPEQLPRIYNRINDANLQYRIEQEKINETEINLIDDEDEDEYIPYTKLRR